MNADGSTKFVFVDRSRFQNRNNAQQAANENLAANNNNNNNVPQAVNGILPVNNSNNAQQAANGILQVNNSGNNNSQQANNNNNVQQAANRILPAYNNNNAQQAANGILQVSNNNQNVIPPAPEVMNNNNGSGQRAGTINSLEVNNNVVGQHAQVAGECPICYRNNLSNGNTWTTLCGHILCYDCLQQFIMRRFRHCFQCRNIVRFEECHQVYQP